MLFNLDRVRLSSLIGHNDFSGCAIKLSTRSLRLTRLRREVRMASTKMTMMRSQYLSHCKYLDGGGPKEPQ